jgi:hypothetical protein
MPLPPQFLSTRQQVSSPTLPPPRQPGALSPPDTHHVRVGFPQLRPIDVDVAGLHLGEALDRLPDHDAGRGQRSAVALQQEEEG